MSLKDGRKFLYRSVLLGASVFLCCAAGQAEDPLNTGGRLKPDALSSTLSTLTVYPPRNSTPVYPSPAAKGWGYLAQRFEQKGIPHDTVVRIFSDPRMPAREPIVFSLDPKESTYNYRKLNTATNRQHALAFYLREKEYFRKAAAQYDVPESVVLSILQVESACGRNTGPTPVFPRLAWLAAAAAPDNLALNLERRNAHQDPQLAARIRSRAAVLEDTFLPHALAALRLADYRGISLFELRGSPSGAIGFPQFLPGNHFRYGVDGDRDGYVDLFSAPDAIFSTAHYLREHGWTRRQLPARQRRAVIWEYNHSKPYVDTVLAMAGSLQKEIDRQAVPEKRTRKNASAK